MPAFSFNLHYYLRAAYRIVDGYVTSYFGFILRNVKFR